VALLISQQLIGVKSFEEKAVKALNRARSWLAAGAARRAAGRRGLGAPAWDCAAAGDIR